MKKCVTCQVLKPLEEFARHRAQADGKQSRCKSCFQEWYAANRVEARAEIDKRRQRVRAEVQQRLIRHLIDHPCVDCGEADVRVLDFDHRQGVDKRFNIAQMMTGGHRWQSVEAEISKCDVRCANCHRRITSERGGWWKQAVFEEAAKQSRDDTHGRLLSLRPRSS